MGALRVTVGRRVVRVEPQVVLVAGFTGRDTQAVQLHLAELAAMGVPRPATTPVFYPVAPRLLLQTDVIQATGSQTSGEVEVALFVEGADVYVTIGSDHTDRRVEAIDIQASKEICPKVVGKSAWKLSEVIEHWDQLELLSWTDAGNGLEQYQRSTLAAILPINALFEAIPWRNQARRFAILAGTVPTVGGLKCGTRFVARLNDPLLERALDVDYRVVISEHIRR